MPRGILASSRRSAAGMLRALGTAALAALLILVALCAHAAEEAANDGCLACHSSEGFAGPDGRPLVVRSDAYAASVHAAFDCTTCHVDATSVSHPDEKLAPVGLDTCATCHENMVAAYRRSIHAAARARGVSEAATCSSCHGSPHVAKPASDRESPTYPLNLPRTCGACHGDAELAKRLGVPAADSYQVYLDSIHGQAITRGGLLVSANCSSCHGAHDILPRTDARSPVARGNVPDTCGKCHVGVKDAYASGSHGAALRAGRKDAPVCIDCHGAHRIEHVATPSWQLAAATECGTCHVESGTTFRDSFHGQITNLGFTVVARCSDCHDAHRVLPASDSRSPIAPANLVTTCRKCHPTANSNFVRYMPHANPRERARNPGLWAVALFMKGLITGVFVFFGAHTVLWLNRSMRERRRGTPHGDAEGGGRIE